VAPPGGLNIPPDSADIQFMTRPWHPEHQKLEEYVLGRLGPPGDPAVARVEEHLLICSYCVNMAEHAVEFAQVIREATTFN
jgi:hypothetical protein